MLRLDGYDFYKLGQVIHPLTFIRPAPLSMVWAEIFSAQEELNRFFLLFPLKTARNPAIELYAALTMAVGADLSLLQLLDANGVPAEFTAVQAARINRTASEFETVLKAELNGWETFFIPPKGAFSTSELIERAEVLVPESSRFVLSAKAVADLREAGKCLAFNLGTAAAFHAARATETVIVRYYEALLGKLPEVKSRNWGAYHRNMSKCARVDLKALEWLSHLTTHYRNPVLHPEESLNGDDAIEFIQACTALIVSIARAIKKLEVNSGNEEDNTLRLGNAQDPLGLESGNAAKA